jgi:hypothetical protein
VQWLKETPDRLRDRGAARGTTIHAVIDNLIQGRSYEIEAEAEPWVMAATRFVQEARPRAERTEGSIYSERTLTAGTFDFLGRLDNAPELGRVLIDWKTNKSGVYADMAVQLVGGYALGAEYLLDDEANEHEWKVPDTALIVHLTQDGYTVRPVPLDKTLRRAFLGALEIRKWEQDAYKSGEGYILPPYQLRLDLDGPHLSELPTNAEVEHARSRLRGLTSEQQLALSSQCTELGISTKLKQMTATDLDRLIGLIKLYEMGEPVNGAEPQEQATEEDRTRPRPARRPMP